MERTINTVGTDTLKMVVGVDPGGTTGIAAYSYVTNEWRRRQVPDCGNDNGIGLRATISAIRGMYVDGLAMRGAQPAVHIIVEHFDFRMAERYRDKIDYTAVEVIGAIKLEFGSVDFVRLSFKGAGLGKGFWTDAKIRRLGLWVPDHRHAMDATRHVLRYRTFDRQEHALLKPLRPEQLEELPEEKVTEVRSNLL